MVEDDVKQCYFNSMPTEVFLYIFNYLSPTQLCKCRQVCLRWKYVIDGLQKSDIAWKKYCIKDFNELYNIAYYKARVGMNWFNIYKSLSLWPRLTQAKETRDEFAAASGVAEEIMDFQVLQNGIIGVHKKGAIVYYDIETLEPSKRECITGNYLKYMENKDTIVILSFQLHLFIIKKYQYQALAENNTSYDNVKLFLLLDCEVYYVTLDDEVNVVYLNEENFDSHFLSRSQESIMCIGHRKNKLHVLTFDRNIYSVVGNDLVLQCALGSTTNILHVLKEYNLLENLDWRVYFQWMYIMNRSVPHGPLRDIIVVRAYGDTVFVGSNWGVLRIYYNAYNSGEFDLYKAEPIKQYNFMEREDCPVLCELCPIIQIDVLESENGHTVIVAMPKKLAVLEFVHTFKRSASVAMLPYRDVQRVKILKIDDAEDSSTSKSSI